MSVVDPYLSWRCFLEAYLDELVAQVAAIIPLEAEVLGDGWDPRVQVAGWLELKGSPTRRLYVAMPFASGLALCSLAVGMTADDVRADPRLVEDLAGEIANIVGGNLWPLLPGCVGISLPQTGLPPNPGGLMRRYLIGGENLLVVGLD